MLILPPEKESKIGSKEPENRQNLSYARGLLCAYTNYESDEHGDYTYFIGEEVTACDECLPEGFQTLAIPAQTYAIFTTNPDPMPDVLLKVWNTVWSISPEDLGGKRTYATDFELYDERAKDHQNIVLDLHIAIEPIP